MSAKKAASLIRPMATGAIASAFAITAIGASASDNPERHAAPHPSNPHAARPQPFEDPTIAVVYSGPDKDAQLLISAGANGQPIRSLSLRAPNGRQVIDTTFADPRGLGQSDARFETPEPTLAELKRTYPAGTYHWVGHTVRGQRLASTTRLIYSLPEVPVITTPTPDATGLPTSELRVGWDRVTGAKKIHLEIEQVKTDRVLTIDLDGAASSFVVPDQFLASGLKYTLDVKAVGTNGNVAVADVDFHTG